MNSSPLCASLSLLLSVGDPIDASVGATGHRELPRDACVLGITAVAPTVLATVTTDCFVLTGDGFHLIASVQFGTVLLPPSCEATFGQGSWEIVDAQTLRVCPPQCLQAGSYSITVQTGAGASASIGVQLADPVAPTLVCQSLQGAGNNQCLYVHVGNSPPPNIVFVILSNSNVPSVIPGLIHAGIGAQFTSYYCGPGVVGECIEYCFAVPPAAVGQTYYFQAITVSPTVPTLPLPVTNVCATTYAPPSTTICGYKFFDHNEDAIWNPAVDPLEVPIGGWRVELRQGQKLVDVTYTDVAGRYRFVRDRDNSVYTVREVAPGGFIGENIPGATWLATTPTSGTVTADAEYVDGPDFGNLSFEVRVGVGRTIGFWHNQNGRALLAGCDPDWRHDLYVRDGLPICLRTNVESAAPALSLFIPPLPAPGAPPPAFFALAFGDAHQLLADWIVSPAYGHAGFQLSHQVAASILNNSCGFMQGTIYVDRFSNGILVSFDEMLAGATALLCDPNAGLTGPDTSYTALRQAMLACTNEFGGINETGDPSSPQVVFGSSQSPTSFMSPY